MSVIAVKNVPLKCNIKHIVKLLAKIINGQFEALNFVVPKNKDKKICYLRLSEKLDPQQVVQRINSSNRFTAFVPDHVPDMPLATKHGKIPQRMRRQLHIPEDENPHQMMTSTHNEIMIELQSKFTGLFNLSKKTGHKLLESIARTVFDRLKHIIETNPEATSSFKLSKSYRKLHPHFGDFQLILSSLHRLQDAAGVPRTQISDQELTAVSTQPFIIDNIPYKKVTAACGKYSNKIVKKILDHVNTLKTEMSDTDTDEDIARKKVREELKKMYPYLPLIIKQVISNHFIPQKQPFHRMRIYGEPFLPSKEQMAAFMKGYFAVKVVRSDRMHNMLRFNLPLAQFAKLIAMDGTVVGGAKLVIRSSDIPLYKLPRSLVNEMNAMFGVEPMETEMEAETVQDEAQDDEAQDDEWTEKWSDEVTA